MENSYLSVAQINNYIKNIFEAEVMLQNISVYGEVSSYNVSNGIAYFNIKDENNLLSCVLFGANRFEQPNIGDLILVTGSVAYYTKGGKLSFNATKIAPYGKGLLYEKFLQLKNKLEKMGYFDPQRKKPLPERVNKIGVVTSATGAVIQDIIDVTRRRNNGVSIVLYPVKVQGVGAEFEIANGINFFSNYDGIDCIIVARGGGSIEDLQPFNTEVVAEAVYNCKKPLVSAVGHETDFTIIDFVSDLRAPTPSAAAEIVVNSKIDDINLILNYVLYMEKCLMRLEQKHHYQLDKYLISMTNCVNNKLIKNNNQFHDLINKMFFNLYNKINLFENETKLLYNTILKLNPTEFTKKGYTKIEKDGKVVKSISDLSVNDKISFSLIDGKVTGIVEELV